MLTQKTWREERPLAQFGSSFYIFFSPPPGPALCELGSQQCCLFYQRSSLWSSDLPLFYFHGFSLLFLSGTVILDSFFLFQPPNRKILKMLTTYQYLWSPTWIKRSFVICVFGLMYSCNWQIFSLHSVFHLLIVIPWLSQIHIPVSRIILKWHLLSIHSFIHVASIPIIHNNS